MFKKMLVLLLMTFATGSIMYPDYPTGRCKENGFICQEDFECCNQKCFAIGNIGFSSCISLPKGNFSTTPKPTDRKPRSGLNGYICLRRNDCCSKLCIRLAGIHLPGICRYKGPLP